MAKFRSKKEDNLTEADKRFFKLRESGYTGPIDKDGNKATSGRAVEILKALRDNT